MTDLAAQFRAAPLDAATTTSLAAHGLGARVVDDTARADLDRWHDAVARGFLEGEPDDKQHEGFAAVSAPTRRKVGVYDAAGPQPDLPVATFASWVSELTVPGGAVPASAISAVTVAPTHRRRGILSAVMAGELRTAAGLGVPAAVLTVSESTIYGRFGFAPAAAAASWRLDVRRARWIGPRPADPAGRIDFVTRAQGRDLAPALHERIRRASPGEISMPGGHWERFFGLRPDAEKPGRTRVAQYRSAGGEVDGLVLYSVTEDTEDFTASTLDVAFLLAATDEAYAALWRFLLSMDLVATIRASELAPDEPLWWMIADQRAATITLRDHQYVRILDVPAMLRARSFDVADTVAFEVTDPLEIAGGTFVLTTDSTGVADVDVVDDPPVGVPLVRLGIVELSALLLGGVSAVTLARAGRLDADDPERIARLFQTVTAPRLSFWY
ncbi:GNAT family N-acetyltransferase [Microbacterium flavum]|uniref:GNAT family N-acetyltransferase n=1 Tax=Microbacterium flavum TaxID=415216 RepID=UPI0024AD7CC3|nr:GNAT family N-acetyltransferase [Microbacterium flavum]